MLHHAAPQRCTLLQHRGVIHVNAAADRKMHHNQLAGGVNEARLPIDARQSKATGFTGLQPEGIAVPPVAAVRYSVRYSVCIEARC